MLFSDPDAFLTLRMLPSDLATGAWVWPGFGSRCHEHSRGGVRAKLARRRVATKHECRSCNARFPNAHSVYLQNTLGGCSFDERNTLLLSSHMVSVNHSRFTAWGQTMGSVKRKLFTDGAL